MNEYLKIIQELKDSLSNIEYHAAIDKVVLFYEEKIDLKDLPDNVRAVVKKHLTVF